MQKKIGTKAPPKIASLRAQLVRGDDCLLEKMHWAFAPALTLRPADAGIASVPGALPQARNEAAPLALNRPLSQDPVIDSHLVFNLRASASSADQSCMSANMPCQFFIAAGVLAPTAVFM